MTGQEGMTEAQRLYEEIGGCACSSGRLPSSFCMSMTEEECEAFHRGGEKALLEYWAKEDFLKAPVI